MATVSIEVQARVAARSLRDAANSMESAMRQAGQQSGQAFGQQLAQGVAGQAPRVAAAMARVSDSTRRVQIEQTLLNQAIAAQDYDRIIAASARVERAHRDNESAMRSLRQAQDAVAAGATGLVGTLTELGTAMGRVAGPAAVGALVAGLGAVVSIASAASGALGLLPAAAAGAGAAFGTLKIGTLGFGDALESLSDPTKFAEALRELSPNAQRAAQDIRSLVPVFDELKLATQDALFDGVGQQLTQLTTTLAPQIQQMTTGIASAFNTAFSGATTQLMSPATSAAIGTTLTNITAAFENLSGAAAPITQALAELTSVGSGFLPEIAQAATDAATAFATFIDEASRSGELEEWIRRGVTVVGQLITVTGELADMFFSLGPTGSLAMDQIVTSVQFTSEAVRLLTGDFSALKDMVPTIGSIAVNMFNMIGSAIDTAVLTPLRALRDVINAIPGLPDIPAIPEIQRFNADGSVSSSNQFGGGGGSFGPPGSPTAQTDQSRPGQYRRRDGSLGYVPPPSVRGGAIPTPLSGPYAPQNMTGGGGSGPVAPYTGGDPLALLQGMPVTAALYGSAETVLQAQHRVQQETAELNALMKDNTATADQITAARNELADAEREAYQAELSLTEAKAKATEQSLDQMNTAASSFADIGNALDKDLGLSRGLPGLAENIARFLGNLATAGFQGQLAAIQAADPRKGGYGAIGILGAQGAFGPEHTGLPQPGMQQGPVGYGAQGYGSPGTAMAGESARDFAHRVMMPYFQQQGFTVGDHAADKYGEHQNGALDIMVDTIADGNKVLAQVLSDPNTYGAIFDNKVYGYGQGLQPRPYSAGNTGNPTQDHQDHVHALFKPNGGNNIPPGATVGGVPGGAPALGGASPMPNNLPIPLPVVIVGGAVGGAPVAGPPVGAPAVGAPAPGALPWGTPGGLPTGVGGGGSMLPGMGAPQGLGQSPLGSPGVGAAAGQSPVGGPTPGGWTPNGGGGIGVSGGGAIGAAMDAGSMALDVMAPGAGQAAQTASKLISRSIQYGGQLASIGVEGLMSTFLPSGSELGDPGKSWLGRAAAGVSGMAPALPTTAGQSQTPAPDQEKQQQQQQNNGPTVNIESYVQAPGRSDQGAARDLAFAAHAGKMPR